MLRVASGRLLRRSLCTLPAAERPGQHLRVYVDMKSPHPPLVLGPALQIANDYDVVLDFLPFTLSFVQMGVTTKHTEDGHC